MAKPDQHPNPKKPANPSGPPVRRSVRDHMDVMDGVVTGLLSRDMDTKTANALTGASRQWGVHVNTIIRAVKAALPDKIKKVLSLPPGV